MKFAKCSPQSTPFTTGCFTKYSIPSVCGSKKGCIFSWETLTRIECSSRKTKGAFWNIAYSDRDKVIRKGEQAPQTETVPLFEIRATKFKPSFTTGYCGGTGGGVGEDACRKKLDQSGIFPAAVHPDSCGDQSSVSPVIRPAAIPC